ncbi:MAG: hypothetical protein ACYC3I_10275 [Gemmataceae bacterium]
MSAAGESEVPEGAAVFPLIPEELGVNPLLLAVVHATVFLGGSDAEVVDAAAAEEALQYLAGYLQRLDGALLRQAREDMVCLTAFAKQEKWPKQLVRLLQNFLKDYGIPLTPNPSPQRGEGEE